MIKDHNKKCETCDFAATSETVLKTHKQEKHRILSNSMGFMMTNNMNENADPGTNEHVNTNDANLALKKNISNLQNVHGVEAEFMLIVKITCKLLEEGMLQPLLEDSWWFAMGK